MALRPGWPACKVPGGSDAQRIPSTPAAIRASLHADQHLSEQAAEQIADLVTQLYTKLAVQVGESAVHLRAQSTFTPDAAELMDSLIERLQDALLADDSLGSEPGWEV